MLTMMNMLRTTHVKRMPRFIYKPEYLLTYRKEKDFAFSSHELCSVISDVENYKHFVPFCDDSKVEKM